MSDCSIKLEHAWASHGPCTQPPRPRAHCHPCRPVEPPCDGAAPRDAIDRGQRPFWNYLDRDNLLHTPGQRPGQHPGQAHGPCEPTLYRACRVPRSCDMDLPIPDRPSHAPRDHRESGQAPRNNASPIEVHIQRLLAVGRLIDLVI